MCPDIPSSTTTRKSRVIAYLVEFLREELAAEKDPNRRKDFESQIQMFRFLPKREFIAEDVIVPSALVSLRLGPLITDCLVVPARGGWVTSFEGRPLQVITPQSPLGEKLLGRRLHDTVEVEVAGKIRRYEVIEIR